MNVEQYWNMFISSNKDYQNRKYIIDSFYNNDGISASLVNLVLNGIKRATTSCYWTYIDGNEEIPNVGTLTIVINSQNEPQCIIETIKQKICPFSEITEEDAFIEGEGDKSLIYWKDAHRHYLKNECKKLKREFSENTPVVFEEFRVIYK